MKKSLLALAFAVATLSPLAAVDAQTVSTLSTTAGAGNDTVLDLTGIGAASSNGVHALSTLGSDGVNNYYFELQAPATGVTSYLADLSKTSAISSAIYTAIGSTEIGSLGTDAYASPVSTSFNLSSGTIYDLRVTGAQGASFIANVQAVSAAPEPATWALMVFGIGAIGVVMRRSRRAAQSALVSA
jgi:hypothetical protein